MPLKPAAEVRDFGETTLTSKGQITVPSALRQTFDLAAGDRLHFTRSSDGRIVVEPRKRRRIVDFARANPIRLEGAKIDVDALIDQAVTKAIAEKRARGRRDGTK